MALILKDRVKETSSSSGTGSVTLGGAFPGYQTFDAVIATGSTVYYTIHNLTAGDDDEFEVGVGTFTSPATLSRDTVLSSSAGGTTKVNFTSGVSGLEVFITQPAEEAIYLNQATGKVEVGGNGTNTVAFTNVTSDLFTGNASAISAINASNVSSGTLDNARTTASSSNGANTIVLRDASGNFTANIITANGSAISAINASNISSGTIDNARTTAASANGASTIVQRDSGGNFAAATITAAVIGDLSGGSNINASNIASGTIANARTTAATANGASTIVLRGASGEFAAGAITGASFSGNGSAITAINASAITTGTLDNARTSAASANGASTIVLRDANGSFAGNVITGTTGTFTNISGNATSLTAINASNISSGTIANARTTASDANGASTIVARDANGSFTANIITANGSAISAINGSNVTTGTVANARTTAATANGASTIVLRGTSGEFSAGAITGVSFTGDGSALSAINASNVSSGTLSATRGGTGSANLTAENVILGNGASAVKVVAPGTANNVLTSNGSTWISQAVAAGGTVIPAGTVMLFAQTSAPTGFTKNTTTGDNSALRVVTGTASTGGSVAFTTAFASQTPTGSVSTTVNNQTATNQAQTATNIGVTATNQAATATNQAITPAGSVSITAVSGSAGATTLSTPQIPSHSHSGGSTNANVGADSGGENQALVGTTGATGGGGSHTHPFSFSSGSGTFSGNSVTALQNSHNHTQDSHNHTQNSHNHTQDAHNHTASSSFTGNAINLAVQYIDVIRATKD
jgi:hypothetical protein